MSLVPLKWYGVVRPCQECQTEGNLFQVGYSADGETLFSFFCPKCKKQFHWRIFFTQLVHDALCRDIMKCHETKKVVPVATHPVITPEDFTEEDLKLFKLMNITPPTKGKPN